MLLSQKYYQVNYQKLKDEESSQINFILLSSSLQKILHKVFYVFLKKSYFQPQLIRLNLLGVLRSDKWTLGGVRLNLNWSYSILVPND